MNNLQDCRHSKPGQKVLTSLQVLLDETVELLKVNQGCTAISKLCSGLTQLRLALGEAVFKAEVIPFCRAHPLFSLVHQDPYSRRAFEKPRGYAGDAVMLDYIYDGQYTYDTSQIGRTVFEGTTRTSNGKSVLERRNLLAAEIDKLLSAKPQSVVASLAAGHLREADLCDKERAQQIEKWIAIDQDPQSLQHIEKRYSGWPIACIQGSVVDLLRGRLDLSEVDFFYSAGLFDYLSDRLACKTVSKMFEHLAPGGSLMISNFTPESAGRDFMDAFMDWRLVYRDKKQMLDLVNALPQQDVTDCNLFADSGGNILYLKLRKSPRSGD